MSAFQSPGIKFVERFDGTPTFPTLDNDATIGIVGLAEKGPIGVPTRVTSFEEARKIFGGFRDDYELMFWLDNFFLNSGGQGELYIVRTAHYTDITDSTTLVAAKASRTSANGGPAYSLSGSSPAITTAPTRVSMRVLLSAADGETVQSITIGGALSGGAAIAAAIQAAIRALTPIVPGNAADFTNCICKFNEDGQYVIFNGSIGADKTVVITDGVTNDLAASLKLGTGNGGTESAAPVNAITFKAATEGVHGNLLSYDIVHQNLVNTNLTANLVNGASQIQVKRSSGIIPGTILEIVDLTAPSNPTIYVEALTVEGDIVTLREAVTLTQTIEGTGPTPASVRSMEFKVVVYRSGVFVQEYAELSMNPRTERYFVTILDDDDSELRATDLDPPTLDEYRLPVAGTSLVLTGGLDGTSTIADDDFIGDEVEKNGLQALRDVDTINRVAIPDRPTAAVHSELLSLAQSLDLWQAHLDPPVGLDSDEMVSYVEDNNLGSDWGEITWPNLLASDPRRRAQSRILAPSAFILGGYARKAVTPGEGVSKPMAGRNNLALGVVGLEDTTVLNQGVRDLLFAARINPISSFRGSVGFFAFGSLTLLPGGRGNGLGESQARAVVLKIKRDVREIVRDYLMSYVVDEELLASLTADVRGYLSLQRGNGLLLGTTDDAAFSVNFGLGLNTPERMLAGEVNGEIAVRVGRTLKFVSITISEHAPARTEGVA